jgi:hypothetical protein
MIQRLRDLRLYASPRFSMARTRIVRPSTLKYTRKSPTRNRKSPGKSLPTSFTSPSPVSAMFSRASTNRSAFWTESFAICFLAGRSISKLKGASSTRRPSHFFGKIGFDLLEADKFSFTSSLSLVGSFNLCHHLWRNASFGCFWCGTKLSKQWMLDRFFGQDGFSEQHLECLAACTQATFESEPVKFRQGFFRDCFLQHCHKTSLAAQPSDWVNNPQFFSRGHA